MESMRRNKGAGRREKAGCIFWLLWCLAAVVLTGAGCGPRTMEGQEEDSGTKRLKVAATLFPYYDFTRQIAGDLVDLELIVPAGMDSHSFEPTPADMRRIQEADVVICNGGAMEHWVGQVLKAVDRQKLCVVTMTDYVELKEEELVEGMEEEDHDHGHPDSRGEERQSHGEETKYVQGEEVHEDIEYDEHIWTSPVNAVTFAQVIRDTLAEKDPDHEDEYRAGYERYEEQLKELHRGFLKVAEERRRNTIIVGGKFPFRYLAEEYGFDYRAAFTGCSTDTEPSARTIAYLIDKVREEEIPAVYYLELTSSRVAEIIGEETGAVPLLLHSCHNVTRRELDRGVTYVELMRQNIENLSKGLDE